ncbi:MULTISPECIES: alpha/beta hydrolase family protein [Streptomyces]|uniref:Acetylhydrolase n=1 Tax=Streptomyces viridochromogenes TaxID=1938 RepID=A0A0L8L9Q5_STRVR|nr:MULTISPECIES: acetylhydrolase [Streptomyces]KOG34933.1 acetylhydrolase [Streptomyces viridochromogenes]
MTRITRAAAAAALACSLALSAGVATAASAPGATASVPDTTVATAAARSARAAALPAPTGPYAVGSTVVPLVDRSRTDPWVPTADGRALMVTLHYPAARSGGGRPAPYATREEARLLARQLGPGVEGDVLARTRTHSRSDARPAPGRRPLVLLSPGFGVSRWTLTHLAEDLASRGYVVASVDHAYESFGISLPDGRTLTCVACTALDEGGVHGSVVTSTRAADMRYVLDRLTGARPVWRHADVIDASRVGMAGHSIGGASAATTMAADPRVDAGVNMDGAFWEDLPAEGLRGRPFMMLGTHDDTHLPGGTDTTWDRTWPALDGWKRWITVAGSEHFTFSDGPVIARHFGLPQAPLPTDRAVAVTRTYVAAFFDRHLRGVPRPVLDGPSPENPEVHFQRR